MGTYRIDSDSTRVNFFRRYFSQKKGGIMLYGGYRKDYTLESE